jgi:caffeoyl-CoA O-methyltransferase
VTLEYEPRHATVAQANLAGAGLADAVEIVVGDAIRTLPEVIDRAEAPFDLVFLDADKVNYGNYLSAIMRGVRSGTLILADNVIRQGKVLSPPASDASALAARSFNALLAADERLEAVILQQVGVKGHDGLAIARVR